MATRRLTNAQPWLNGDQQWLTGIAKGAVGGEDPGNKQTGNHAAIYAQSAATRAEAVPWLSSGKQGNMCSMSNQVATPL